MSPAAYSSTHRIKSLAAALALALLCACGGSTADDETDAHKDTQPLNCKTNPELCK